MNLTPPGTAEKPSSSAKARAKRVAAAFESDGTTSEAPTDAPEAPGPEAPRSEAPTDEPAGDEPLGLAPAPAAVLRRGDTLGETDSRLFTPAPAVRREPSQKEEGEHRLLLLLLLLLAAQRRRPPA